MDHSCINPILQIGLTHKRSIDYKSLITLLTKYDVTVTLGWQDSINLVMYINTLHAFVDVC